jgi:hypothetical protein
MFNLPLRFRTNSQMPNSFTIPDSNSIIILRRLDVTICFGVITLLKVDDAIVTENTHRR